MMYRTRMEKGKIKNIQKTKAFQGEPVKQEYIRDAFEFSYRMVFIEISVQVEVIIDHLMKFSLIHLGVKLRSLS